VDFGVDAGLLNLVVRYGGGVHAQKDIVAYGAWEGSVIVSWMQG
jgi:hypothetical protein